MIPISKALKIIDAKVESLTSEQVSIGESVTRVLWEDIIADTDLPPFDRSQMDGFAVLAADAKNAPVALEIVGESAAGKGWHKRMKRGEAVRIMTGAPLPVGADAVQKLELTRESSVANKNGEKGGRLGVVEILEATEKGRFIVRQASEVEGGTAIFHTGEIITENMIAAMAAFGYAKVKVSKQPRVAILGTGSEIVEINKRPGRDQIRNSNSVMLDILCRRFGAEPVIFPIVRDKISDLKFQISNAAKKSDIVVLTGGVSVGKYDHTKQALADLGAEIFFDKVKLKPGKPAVFARIGKTLIFGLPGNPVSAAVTFHLFVRKAILRMQGASMTDSRSGFVVLGSDAKSASERDTYLPARLETNGLGHLIAHPLKWSGSSDFIGFSRANALVILPSGTSFSKGKVVTVAYF